MTHCIFDHHCKSPDATERLAHCVGAALTAPAVLCLSGPVGAGKTHFARTLIQYLLTQPEDVPSPTFTLVQTYDSHKGPIWHADLYRLTGPEEVEELGLTEAFETAICLVEWPDRLAGLMPKSALSLQFEALDDPDQRRIRAHCEMPEHWQALSAELAND